MPLATQPMHKLDLDCQTVESKTPNTPTRKTSNALARYPVIASWSIAFEDPSNTPAEHERSFKKDQKPSKFLPGLAQRSVMSADHYWTF
ncbi:hypothetical protein PtA15_1A275 [Puccinia triticina]|uniref:Uncharacterized protein n=1 Tax=Puccinia triticina TaxID=208348 RepID=A0ABY7CDN6_9BASI|nr:uncharacterized protein PtA15_1A275 [Puccinia triticina]WAQ80937.1 hypothetical protein PtA15_1A275 [Puccinia triticina]